MKILRIKLTNLNSLRGEHEVNFEMEPLASAGLFAITGPTGAGKSTVLDAITLALYGRAARYANDPNPEDMMSRHCGECRAEVEFAVASGRYRAEWHLRRAKGKADGNMQAPKRYVYDASGQALAASIREAEEWIEKLVGLDYQRFLRSVLLAQGEFARFLKASPDERAGLLESLTGTAIYSELSELTHREATRRETELQRKEDVLGQIVLLTDDQRLEREAQTKNWEATLAQQRIELGTLNNHLAQSKELRSALSSEQELVKQQETLATRKQAAEAELSRLTQHHLTIPYGDDLSRLDTAAESAREQHAKLLAVSHARKQADQAWITAIAAACEFSKILVEREEATFRDGLKAVTKQDTMKQEAATWLAGHAEDKELETQLPELLTQIGRLESLRRDVVKAEEQSVALTGKVMAQQKAIADAEKGLVEAARWLKSKETEKAAAVKALEALIGGKTKEAREKEVEEIRTQVEAIGRLLDLEEACQKQRKNLERDQKNLDDLGRRLETAQTTAKDASQKKEAAVKTLALHEDHLHKAQLVASFEDHRAALKPGEACPLCGSQEHPFADEQQRSVSFDMIEAEVRKAKTEFKAAEANALAAELAVTLLTADQSNLTKLIKDTTDNLKAGEKRIEALAKASRIETTETEDLCAAKDEKDALIQKLRADLTEIHQAGETTGTCETARLRAENAAEIAKQMKSNEEKVLIQLEGQLRGHSEATRELNQGISTLTGSLESLLKPCMLPLPEAGEERPLQDVLKNRKSGYQTQVEAFRQASTSLERAKVESENTRKSLAALQEKARSFHSIASAHQAEVEGADPVQCEDLQSGWESLEDAAGAVRLLENEVTRALAAVEERKQESERATARLGEAGAQLAGRLAGSVFASVDALRTAKLSIEETDRLQKLEQNLKSESDKLKGGLDGVRLRITKLREQKAVESEAVALLETKFDLLQKANDELVTSIAAFSDELKRDQESREKRAAQTLELEQERKRMRVWGQLQGLIGSHDGRKFRRYAQGISLDILVHHANEHLQRLTDRYRLQRRNGEELQLEIEDLYQAGVMRPMASLSGGESFLASLALALGLADLAGRNTRIDSLFIDEGFGSLDADTLDLAISALETLRQDNKTVGVISHVELLKERITTQIIVEKQSGGTSQFRLAS